MFVDNENERDTKRAGKVSRGARVAHTLRLDKNPNVKKTKLAVAFTKVPPDSLKSQISHSVADV